MLGIVIIFGICALATGIFIILELNWSINNLMLTWDKLWGPLKIFILPMAPICFLPVLIDVAITLAVTSFLGAEGMMGLLTSGIICSAVAGYLYYMRRRHNWKYI
jgi:hypothetical protein